jgi:hypothetical protein
VAKYLSSLSVFLFILCAITPVNVHADRYQARFELVSTVGLSYKAKVSSSDTSQCSREFDAGNLGGASCSAFSVSLNNIAQHEATILIDGLERDNWRESFVSQGQLDMAFNDEISVVLQ